jgi:hypothetical protein
MSERSTARRTRASGSSDESSTAGSRPRKRTAVSNSAGARAGPRSSPQRGRVLDALPPAASGGGAAGERAAAAAQRRRGAPSSSSNPRVAVQPQPIPPLASAPPSGPGLCAVPSPASQLPGGGPALHYVPPHAASNVLADSAQSARPTRRALGAGLSRHVGPVQAPFRTTSLHAAKSPVSAPPAPVGLSPASTGTAPAFHAAGSGSAQALADPVGLLFFSRGRVSTATAAIRRPNSRSAVAATGVGFLVNSREQFGAATATPFAGR